MSIQKEYLDLLREIDKAAGDPDVSAQQALLIANLGDEHLSGTQIMKKRYYAGTNANYNLNRLEKTGHIIRSTNRFDRRIVTISLTPKGREVAFRVRAALAERVRETA
jgi:DNA-binding MarR family transcriptional regulator